MSFGPQHADYILAEQRFRVAVDLYQREATPDTLRRLTDARVTLTDASLALMLALMKVSAGPILERAQARLAKGRRE